MNNYFIEAVQNLDIEEFNCDTEHDTQLDVIDDILEKYKLHPSILKIKANVKTEIKFKFRDTTVDEIYLQIKVLDPKKSCMENDIPLKILIEINDIASELLSKNFNESKILRFIQIR